MSLLSKSFFFKITIAEDISKILKIEVLNLVQLEMPKHLNYTNKLCENIRHMHI